MINVKQAKKYCKEDISLIENYEQAVNDNNQMWVCHHREEIKVLPSGMTVIHSYKELKEKGLWIACADMDGENMYKANLSGAIGIVIGNEGSGVSKLVKKNCDFTVSIPVRGEIESLNASVAAGVLAYEVVRARTM